MFDKEKFWGLVRDWEIQAITRDVHHEMIESFIQSACKAHAMAEVKRFVDEIRPTGHESHYVPFFGGNAISVSQFSARINCAFKKRGIDNAPGK